MSFDREWAMTEINRLRAEIEALRADAERWRSLRKWDRHPLAATDTVWVEAGKKEEQK
jgi:hypothetical protein